MKVVKPQLLSLLYRPFLFRSRQRLSVSTLAGFALDAGAPRLIPEIALWPVLAEATGGMWDEGLPKMSGEVLMFGSCHNPGGVARPVSSVRVELGEIAKRLAVIGNRVWDGAAFSDPEPFTQMPLDWEHAFGGPEFARNPKGKGIATVTDEGDRRAIPLPNIEDPAQLIRSRRDRPEPVGLTPLDIMWPQRAEKAGSYDKSYLERHFPGFPPDVQPDFFHLAAPDQWIKGYFKGDESYLLENLHPKRALVEGRLPGVKARCFVRLRGGPPFDEIDMRLETVVFLPDHDMGVLVFRGATAIVEDDAADVEGLFAAAEALDESRPAAHYYAVFERRLNKDENLLDTLNDNDLLPAFAATPALALPVTAQPGDQAREQVMSAVRRELAEQGLDPELALAGTGAPELTPPTDMAELEALENRMTATLEEETLKLRASVNEEVAAAGEQAPAGGPPAPLLESLLPALMEAGAATPALEEQLRAADAQALEMYRESAHLQTPARSLPPELSDPRRDALLERYAAKASLAELDLTGCNLAGLQLEKAGLGRALLASADLSGTHLAGANLAQAVLAHANLRGAMLEGCNAQGANLGGARIEGTRLDRANLREAVLDKASIDKASFQDADLTGASLFDASIGEVSFEAAHAPEVDFYKLDLARSRFARARLNKANFIELSLEGVDFSNADLELVTFLSVNAARANFGGARLRGVHAVMGCSFAGANFEGADLEGAFLRGCNLEGTNFYGARLVGADLSECRLKGARLSRAQATEALFVRAQLDGADLRQVNLMQAMLQKATLFGADLSGSNLFAANLGQIRLDPDTKLTGCNLKRVLVHPQAKKPE